MRYFAYIFILAFCCEAKYIPEDGIYSVAEQMPEYIDGMKEFDAHISKLIANEENIQKGSVFVSFIVNSNGTIDQCKIVRSLNEKQDLIALEAIKSAPAHWKPGLCAGKPVDVKLVYPIHFK